MSISPMKRILLLLPAALLVFTVQASACKHCGASATMSRLGIPSFVQAHGEDAQMSVMTLTVKKAKDATKAEALKADLMKLNGVKDVNVCTQSGTVKVSYNKAELGCCSRIHTSLKDSGWKYTMVSNEEKPACQNAKPGGCEGKSTKSCPGKAKTETGA